MPVAPHIVVDSCAGRRVAVLGLARSGLAAARALAASGAQILAWDDNQAVRDSLAAEIPFCDLAQADWRAFSDEAPGPARADVLRALIPYAEEQLRHGTALRAIACHALGLYHGRSGGRRFRQILSDSDKLRHAGPGLFLEALEAVEPVTADSSQPGVEHSETRDK